MMTRMGLLGIACLMAVRALGVDATVDKALGLADRGLIEEAIASLEKPADNQERALLARLLDYDGDPEKAIATLRGGLRGEIEDLDLLDALITIHARRARAPRGRGQVVRGFDREASGGRGPADGAGGALPEPRHDQRGDGELGDGG